MRKLIFTLLFISPFWVIGQIQQTQTKVNVQNTTVNQRDYADRLPEVLDEIKPNSINYDEVKGFVLVKVSHTYKRGRKMIIKTFKELFEDTPFKLIDGTKKPQPYREGYIYITQSSSLINNNNYNTSWIFKNHKKRTVYAFNTTNIGVTAVLAKIGITTY